MRIDPKAPDLLDGIASELLSNQELSLNQSISLLESMFISLYPENKFYRYYKRGMLEHALSKGVRKPVVLLQLQCMKRNCAGFAHVDINDEALTGIFMEAFMFPFLKCMSCLFNIFSH